MPGLGTTRRRMPGGRRGIARLSFFRARAADDVQNDDLFDCHGCVAAVLPPATATSILARHPWEAPSSRCEGTGSKTSAPSLSSRRGSSTSHRPARMRSGALHLEGAKYDVRVGRLAVAEEAPVAQRPPHGSPCGTRTPARRGVPRRNTVLLSPRPCRLAAAPEFTKATAPPQPSPLHGQRLQIRSPSAAPDPSPVLVPDGSRTVLRSCPLLQRT